mgnify:CR=1 FL=1
MKRPRLRLPRLPKLPFDGGDVVLGVGVVLFTVGVGMVYLPLAFILPGAAIITLHLYSHWRGATNV